MLNIENTQDTIRLQEKIAYLLQNPHIFTLSLPNVSFYLITIAQVTNNFILRGPLQNYVMSNIELR